MTELKVRRILEKESELLAALLAIPELREGAGFLSEVDEDAIAAFIKDTRNIVLVTEDEERAALGAIIFHWQEPAIYEVHTLAQREIRGKRYIRAVYEALRMVFLMDTCMELYTRVPDGNEAALGLVRLVHGKKVFRARNADYYLLRWDDWLWGRGVCSGEALISFGSWFHARLEQQMKDQGRAHEKHDDDEDHDRMVGAACELLFNGLVEKSFVLYNRWAKLAGYAQISIVVQAPLVINIGDALLQVDFAHRELLLLEVTPTDLHNMMTPAREQPGAERRML